MESSADWTVSAVFARASLLGRMPGFASDAELSPADFRGLNLPAEPRFYRPWPPLAFLDEGTRLETGKRTAVATDGLPAPRIRRVKTVARHRA